MKKLLIVKKNQFEVFLAEVVNFNACQHKFLVMCKSPIT